MNNVSSIEVKDINSVERYASQYVNGEQVTLITKSGEKYYTNGKGGYFKINSVNETDKLPTTPSEKPNEESIIDKMKKVVEKLDVIEKLDLDASGNLLFDGSKIADAKTPSQGGTTEPTDPDTPGQGTAQKIQEEELQNQEQENKAE